ncbi:3-keto-5-aminohexanoate cleavage protein [Roseovarius indicus]|uniref:3-keto-5-aminohexanoate cleavage enzyme n=1 Tax=Roseovarius indicus TaxID=540747 RepID=A0A0T5P3I7_9RHOB|nr:3-keto-5-aminohexanoate cleavage protein [Roseovarius indicus]KRS15757.1 NADPH:quinone reductase [Roseovarius indicus]QEW25175.1 3-keto-5-aminohexanoate cleavage enzyme [Roseovarius indicus]SFE18048.1 Uncharacterized conserved protein, DUF849 family [Roseovarius indicus]
MKQDVFITCAVTGAGDGPKKNPNVPVTPEQIAADVVAVAEAGAAIAHIHVRDTVTTEGSRDTALYAEVMERVRDAGTDIIINFTAGMGGDLEVGTEDPKQFGAATDLVSQAERVVHIDALRPDVCTLDCGTYNMADGNVIYVSTPDQIREGARMIRGFGVKPELEVFDLGHLGLVLRLIDEGAFEGPAMVQFCLGVGSGAPATPGALKAMSDALGGRDVVWSAFGVGRMQLPMVAQAALLGGNVRVGLEDNIWLSKGVPATNVDLVNRARTIVESMGGRVQSVQATRDELGLGGRQ